MLQKVITPDGEEFRSFKCPGCKDYHATRITGKEPRWGFNGNETLPTFTPSILVRVFEEDGSIADICHSFVTDGKIQFLNDCTHELAGKTVTLFGGA